MKLTVGTHRAAFARRVYLIVTGGGWAAQDHTFYSSVGTGTGATFVHHPTLSVRVGDSPVDAG